MNCLSTRTNYDLPLCFEPNFLAVNLLLHHNMDLAYSKRQRTLRAAGTCTCIDATVSPLERSIYLQGRPRQQQSIVVRKLQCWSRK